MKRKLNTVRNLLLVLKKCHSTKATQSIIEHLDEKTITLLCETLYNLLWNPKFDIPESKYKKLTSHISKNRTDWGKLTSKSTKCSCKRKILKKQFGSGFFSILLSTLIPLITSLIVKK